MYHNGYNKLWNRSVIVPHIVRKQSIMHQKSILTHITEVDNPMKDKLIKSLTSALSHPSCTVPYDIKHYFDTMYNTDVVDADSNILSFGPLIHCDNKIEKNISDLYVRSCYKELYDTCIAKYQCPHVFVTGTSGIGISVFRSYVVWRQIQDAKHHQQSCIILMSKSNHKCRSPTLLLVIVDGVIILTKSFIGTNKCLDIDLILEDVENKMPIYHHVDVTDGISSTDAHGMKRNYYYTDPNMNAWKEAGKSRLSCVLFYLPTWTLNELIDFYLKIGWKDNRALINIHIV